MILFLILLGLSALCVFKFNFWLGLGFLLYLAAEFYAGVMLVANNEEED